MPATVSEIVSPQKVFRPVRHSYRTHPNAQMSVRLSRGLPRACSGLMYAAVPRITPLAVPLIIVIEFDRSADVLGASAFANPKSKIFTLPSGVIFVLAGFRSR